MNEAQSLSGSSDTLPEANSRLGWLPLIGLVSLPVLFATIAWGGAAYFFPTIRNELSPSVPVAMPEITDGARLYALHCAYCHGKNGDGNGLASLTIKARYFGAEPYKFITTTGTKIPTDEDLYATLRRGIEGSSMPSFAHLSDEQLKALVDHIRVLTRKGLQEELLRKAENEYDEGGDEPDPVAIAAKVDTLCVVGSPLAIPTSYVPADPTSIEAGRKIFLAQCANCHGPEGLGNGTQVASLKNDNGTPAKPRNLTSGVFKGGKEKKNLYARLVLGIPGTPMPALPTGTSDEDTGHLINFILSLSAPTTASVE